MERLASARIVVWQGGALWIVDAAPADQRRRKRTDLHAHHAIQVTLGLGGAFRLGAGDAFVDDGAAAVAADTAHDFEAEGLVALLFVEPESAFGRAISARLFTDGPLAVIDDDWQAEARRMLLAACRDPVSDRGELAELGKGLIALLAGSQPAHRPDLRVRKMIAEAARRIEGPVSLADVVEVGGLSAGRLRHLFVDQTGLPFKSFLLWLRLTRAVEVAATGAPLTEAAHQAGFSDSAHFSRTFRRMFGLAPAELRMT